MNCDKKRLYIISAVMFAALLALLFVDFRQINILTACLLLPLTVVTCVFVRKRGSLSINRQEVVLLSTIIGVIYAVVLQLTGLFFGFHKNPYFVNINIFLTKIVPIAVIIVTAEIIRSILLKQKNSLVSVLVFFICIFAEILTFSSIVGIKSFNHFMDFVGLTLFPAISANVYYHYVSKKFGALPNIVFRLITTLYIYFMKNTSAMSDALLSCIKMIVPIILLAFLSALYEKGKKNSKQKGQKLSLVAVIFSTVIITAVAMLISCQFRFGAIVIATESMTGEINKGDMIIYEKYDHQKIKEGQVIVFLDNQTKIVHRVVRIERIGNEVRYITKGDANESEDFGYITDQDIVGLTDIKVAYIGYPTLWLRSLLENNN